MIALLERLLPLWTEPVDGRGDPEAAFGEMYADPVLVNGTEMSLDALVARARSLQQAFDQLGMDILDAVETPDRVVADDLGLLRQLDAARLNGLRGTRQRRGPPHRLSDAVLPPVLRRLTRFARARH
jgi:hypothetical protein